MLDVTDTDFTAPRGPADYLPPLANLDADEEWSAADEAAELAHLFPPKKQRQSEGDASWQPPSRKL